jgi:hypothetical protein
MITCQPEKKMDMKKCAVNRTIKCQTRYITLSGTISSSKTEFLRSHFIEQNSNDQIYYLTTVMTRYITLSGTWTETENTN